MAGPVRTAREFSVAASYRQRPGQRLAHPDPELLWRVGEMSLLRRPDAIRTSRNDRAKIFSHRLLANPAQAVVVPDYAPEERRTFSGHSVETDDSTHGAEFLVFRPAAATVSGVTVLGSLYPWNNKKPIKAKMPATGPTKRIPRGFWTVSPRRRISARNKAEKDEPIFSNRFWVA